MQEAKAKEDVLNKGPIMGYEQMHRQIRTEKDRRVVLGTQIGLEPR